MQFFAMVLTDVGAVALQAKSMIGNGDVEPIQDSEDVSLVQRPVQKPILEALGAKAENRPKLDGHVDRLVMVVDGSACRKARRPKEHKDYTRHKLLEAMQERRVPQLAVGNLQGLMVAHTLQGEMTSAWEVQLSPNLL